MGVDSTTSIIAEAGSREAPALPPGLLTEAGEASARPTKLFIGGISRHTTTKQLRDHFSQFGRVLDCVAMRQPDGRPRGFGYVTLDSPSAADRCLREPQMIDNRIVDMKRAVPEGSGSGATSPQEACFNMKMFGGQADFNMNMFAGQGFSNWPETSGGYWWGGKDFASQGSGLDCVDLLSGASSATSPPTSPHGLMLESMGLRGFGELSGHDNLDVLGASGKMSANAPEFVPLGSQVTSRPATEAIAESTNAGSPPTSQAKKATRARPPLGELTNIVEVEDLLKPFKSPTSNKLADIGQGHLSIGNQFGIAGETRRTGFLLDGDEVHESSPSSSGSGTYPAALSPESSSPEPAEASPEVKDEEGDDANEQDSKSSRDGSDDFKELEDDNGPESPGSSNESGSDGEDGVECDIIVDPDSLPSMGSALHALGECKRCNFFPKGRCQNGKDCTFCHFPHDKRKPSRQEKRERRAAWLEQQGDQVSPKAKDRADNGEVGLHADTAVHFPSGPLLTAQVLQTGCFPMYPDEDIYSDETLAYSIFPGLPPIHATKLPAPLPLPGMEMASQAGPPGLAPPSLGTKPWLPEAEASSAARSLLSTGQTMPGMFDQCAFQSAPLSTAVLSSAPLSSAFLGTVPTPLRTPASTAASTPLPTPMATPTAAVAAEAHKVFPAAASTSTSGTQTGDYKCRRCEIEPTQEAGDSSAKQGCQWARDELLRLRDKLAKMPRASEASNGSIGITTAAITASPST